MPCALWRGVGGIGSEGEGVRDLEGGRVKRIGGGIGGYGGYNCTPRYTAL